MHELKRLRKQHRLTQAELGRILGVTRATVCRVERGHENPGKRLKSLIEVWIERQHAHSVTDSL